MKSLALYLRNFFFGLAVTFFVCGLIDHIARLFK